MYPGYNFLIEKQHLIENQHLIYFTALHNQIKALASARAVKKKKKKSPIAKNPNDLANAYICF